MSGFPIHARFAHPDWGYEADQELAAKHLLVGAIYTITSMQVGRSSSVLFLDGFPDVAFNTALFEPA